MKKDSILVKWQLIVAFGIYTGTQGRMLVFVSALIMMPLSTTEIKTAGWITGIMKSVFEMTKGEVAAVGNSTDLLAINDKPYRFTSWLDIGLCSRYCGNFAFFRDTDIHRFSLWGLLAASAALEIVGLYTLSFSEGVALFVAASLYGVRKTFFWPTDVGNCIGTNTKGRCTNIQYHWRDWHAEL